MTVLFVLCLHLLDCAYWSTCCYVYCCSVCVPHYTCTDVFVCMLCVYTCVTVRTVCIGLHVAIFTFELRR